MPVIVSVTSSCGYLRLVALSLGEMVTFYQKKVRLGFKFQSRHGLYQCISSVSVLYKWFLSNPCSRELHLEFRSELQCTQEWEFTQLCDRPQGTDHKQRREFTQLCDGPQGTENTQRREFTQLCDSPQDTTTSWSRRFVWKKYFHFSWVISHRFARKGQTKRSESSKRQY